MYSFIHTSLGLCFWDIPTLIVLIAGIVMFAVHKHNQKKRENDFEDELEKKIKEMTEGTVEGEEPVEA